jgi:hypothetical protein
VGGRLIFGIIEVSNDIWVEVPLPHRKKSKALAVKVSAKNPQTFANDDSTAETLRHNKISAKCDIFARPRLCISLVDRSSRFVRSPDVQRSSYSEL